MTWLQRVILLVGASFLVLALWTTPRVIYDRGLALPASRAPEVYGLIEPWEAGFRVVAVLGVTMLLWLAVRRS